MDKHDKKCLNDYEIGAYVDGELLDEERESFEKRLFACKECWDDFFTMRQVVIMNSDQQPAGEVPASLMQKAISMYPEKNMIFDVIVGFLKESIKILQFADGFEISTPLPAGGFRSGTTEHPSMIIVKKSFKEIEVELDIEKTGDEICNIRVAVEELIKKRSFHPLRVELIADGRELVSNLLENGETFLEDIGTGHYTIKVHKKGAKLGEISLKIE